MAFESQMHPRDWTTRAAQGSLSTPKSPDGTRWGTSTFDAGTLYPWSVEDFLASAHSIGGSQVGAALGTFADVRGGSDLNFKAVAVAAETLLAPRWTPAVPNWDAYYHCQMKLRWVNDLLRI